MAYKELLKKQIGRECTFNPYHNKCTINFGAPEPFASEGIIDDVTDDYLVIKSQSGTMIYLLVNTAIAY